MLVELTPAQLQIIIEALQAKIDFCSDYNQDPTEYQELLNKIN